VRTYVTSSSLAPGSLRSYTEERRFDGAGRLARVEWPCGRWVFGYDAFGHLTARTDPDEVIERWTHSPTGLLLSHRFTDGSTVDYIYDANRRPQQPVIKP